MEFLNFSSVELLPNAKASAAFTVDSRERFSDRYRHRMQQIQKRHYINLQESLVGLFQK